MTCWSSSADRSRSHSVPLNNSMCSGVEVSGLILGALILDLSQFLARLQEVPVQPVKPRVFLLRNELPLQIAAPRILAVRPSRGFYSWSRFRCRPKYHVEEVAGA